MEADPVDTPWGQVETALDGTIIRANHCFSKWTGRSLDELLLNFRWKTLLAPASVILYETHFAPRLHALHAINDIALDLKRPDGTRFPVLACAIRVEANEKQPTRIIVTLFDATETRKFEKELREAKRVAERAAAELLESNRKLHAQNEKLRVTLDSIADAVVTTDTAGRITSFNPTAEKITGLAAHDAIGKKVISLGRFLDPITGVVVRRNRLFQRDLRNLVSTYLYERNDGGVFYISGTLSTVMDPSGKMVGTVYVCHDATGTHLSNQKIAYDASHDHLTGLINRREFERLCHTPELENAASRQDDVLLYIDLDQFKAINDSSGHAAGDDALLKASQAMLEVLQPTDSLARLGGDEFGVILYDAAIADGLVVAEKLRVRLEQLRFIIGPKIYGITASIGVAILKRGADSAQSAMIEADMACIAAKEAGRNRVHLFSALKSDLWRRQEELSWVSRIRQGLDEHRFVLFFQPIVPIGEKPSKRQKGELLLRFRDDDGNLILPSTVISAAERFNLMGQVDRWVIKQAFDWLSVTDHLEVSINISGQSFGDIGFRRFVFDALAQCPFDAARVCFEITETAAIANIESALHFAAELKRHNIQLALDDFGAGLSSFGYLRMLSPNYIKIDGSFVKSMLVDPVSMEIVKSIFRIARACNLMTVAEWVEDEATLRALKEIGIDYAQGFHTGRPGTLEQALEPDRFS